MEIWTIRRISGAWIVKNGFFGNEIIFNDGDTVSYWDDEKHVVVFEVSEETPKWRMTRALWGMQPNGPENNVFAKMHAHVGKCSPVVVNDHSDDHMYDD